VFVVEFIGKSEDNHGAQNYFENLKATSILNERTWIVFEKINTTGSLKQQN
jgi:hypothetical protein